jgi:hypothetical protein
MKCTVCGQEISFEDDAIDQLIESRLVKKSAMSLMSDHRHLRAHPEFNCQGDPDARRLLANIGINV